jgi:hypothetical protein
VNLLIVSYCYVKSNYVVDIDCEEEYISALILDYIDKCPQASEWNIDITPEYRLYTDEVLNKKKSAKTSPRIDLRFSGWANKMKRTYFVEAKNLIEIDTLKKGNTITVSAQYLHKRYIKTGIDNYLSGRYPLNGCLVGYILQGKTENIINLINKYLRNHDRKSEILITKLPNSNLRYLSKHEGNITINHIMLNFMSD